MWFLSFIQFGHPRCQIICSYGTDISWIGTCFPASRSRLLKNLMKRCMYNDESTLVWNKLLYMLTGPLKVLAMTMFRYDFKYWHTDIATLHYNCDLRIHSLCSLLQMHYQLHREEQSSLHNPPRHTLAPQFADLENSFGRVSVAAAQEIGIKLSTCSSDLHQASSA